MLKTYFDTVIRSLSSYNWVKSVDTIRYGIAENDQKYVLLYRLRAVLSDGSQLEMMERVVNTKTTGNILMTKYSFHWQKANHNLIKRWDNAPHHSEIATYPHHIHVGREENVMANFPVMATDVFLLIDREFYEQNTD